MAEDIGRLLHEKYDEVAVIVPGNAKSAGTNPCDIEKVRDDVMDRLASFVDPKTGRKPVKAIFRREEVFKGKHADTAPDILMEPAEGYSLTHAKSAVESSSVSDTEADEMEEHLRGLGYLE